MRAATNYLGMTGQSKAKAHASGEVYYVVTEAAVHEMMAGCRKQSELGEMRWAIAA